MTIKALMDRIAGDDLEWADLDIPMVHDMADAEVQYVALSGIDNRDFRAYAFRLPIEKLRKKK
jgi:hypothetical protein